MNVSKKSMKIQTHNNLSSKIKLSIGSEHKTPYFCSNMYNILTQYKSFIDNEENQNLWDYTKKISNDFELINQNGINSITSINPLSRSYYKFREIIVDFDLLPKNNNNIKYAALAEGPGGFIESFIHTRKKEFLGRNDYIQCITLKSDCCDIPNWNKAKKILNFKNIKYCYGKDNTGNLYNIENIIDFRNKMGGNEANLVSADGGFDFSNDFNKQEQLSCKLIFAEIITAYSVNKKGGHFVLKIFDSYMKSTLKLIYLVSLFYENVYITKPLTSRPANSEKYLVCKNFKGFDQSTFNNLLENLNYWHTKNPNGILLDIKGVNMPNSFLHHISTMNSYLLENQIKNILKTLIFIKLNIECEELSMLRKTQIKYAILWCDKYNINLNYKSKYVKC